ncbi:UAA transporter [Wallemia mellicola]|uniref:UDP-galactose transporter homolog 1 n=2 Tax=Wallemia mellicola TaxID=1708541 RepID=A0A4V4MG78_9BASI|nr:hypothetical protein E3Q24_04229 [Wallemia mellicola]TIB78942.1 UAA transporter [Wallemia mellicola]TIB83209.1 UAA transporter [Wallemia mellicola]TIC11724.1 UAA transporter [Wallemia mellicola]TIC19409.1 UAA transporter [Wallemia mellicola]
MSAYVGLLATSMTIVRLATCVSGVYACFLLWALVQEKLSTTAYTNGENDDVYFRSSLFLNTVQSLASALSAFVYLNVRRTPGQSIKQLLAFNGGKTKYMLTGIVRVAVLQAIAQVLGFTSLKHISYPTMVLAKSCKLVPVMLMNVLIYRKKFAPYKYAVVLLVTIGISMFTLLKKSSKASTQTDSSFGLSLLFANLIIDGLINSSQDAIFQNHSINGTQMMFWMNLASSAVTSTAMIVGLPAIPLLGKTDSTSPEIYSAIHFVKAHPEVLKDIGMYAGCGALGQLFIFETLQHFGSLALVTITLTRKLFTILLSVFIYNHKLSSGQWAGAATVFAGISVEAAVKRKEVLDKRVFEEKKRSELKSL